jgi:urease accessory protein
MTVSALLLLADSRFPTGAHAHSAGLEAAHARGHLDSLEDLTDYIEGRLLSAAPTEAAFAAAACRWVDRWAELDAELTIRTTSPRTRALSRSLGRQLVRPACRAWPSLDAEALRSIHPDGPLQPIALGAVAGAAGLTPAEAALISLHHLIAMATTAAIRLIGLDPFEVHALAARFGRRLEAIAAEAADAAEGPPSSLPSVTSVLAEILAEDHATWEVRLFAS